MAFVPVAAAAIGSAVGSAAPVVSAVGAGIGAAGSLQAGSAARGASNFNAEVSRQNAVQAAQNAAQDESSFRRQAAKLRGAQVAATGASGIAFTGSALDVLEETVAVQEMDALNIRRQGALQARSSRTEAILAEQQGSAAARAAQFQAAGQLLGGLGGLGKLGGTGGKNTNSTE